jgi:hypothetical protein
MDIVNCYKILGANESDTLQEIKSKFYRLAMLSHPDKGGDLEKMKLLNVAYEILRKNHVKISENMEKDGDAYHVKYDIDPELLKRAVEVQNVDASLDVYIAGAWIWVTGNTKEFKDILKGMGLRYAPQKQAWYFAGCRSFSRGKYSLDKIYRVYGKYEPTQNTLRLQ